jgi:hypothetical protein
MTAIKDIKFLPPKILLMGPYGTGKTALALTLGEYAEVIDLDNGLRTAVGLKDKFTEARLSVEARLCWEERYDIATSFAKAKSNILDVVSSCRKKTYKKKALIVDGLTNLVDCSVRSVCGNQGDPNKKPTLPVWGMAIGEIENLLIALKSLPIVVVLIAHTFQVIQDGEIDEGETDSATGKKFDSKPLITEVLACSGQKLPGKVTAAFDEVWRMEVQGNRFCLRSIRLARAPARSRACLPDKTDANLGLVEILKKIDYDITKD